MQFEDVYPYQPRIVTSSLVTMFGASVTLIAINGWVGWGLGSITGQGRWVEAVYIFGMLLGLGGSIWLVASVGHIRDPRWFCGLAMIAGIVSVLTLEIHRARMPLLAFHRIGSILDFGSFLKAIVLAWMGWYGGRLVTKRPYCETCQAWKRSRRIGACDLEYSILDTALNMGDLQPILDATWYRKIDKRTTQLEISYCKTCREASRVEVDIYYRQNAEAFLDHRCGTISLPGAALEYFDQIPTIHD